MAIRPEEIQGLREEITKLTGAVSGTRAVLETTQKTVGHLEGSVSKLRETVAVLKDRTDNLELPAPQKRPCEELEEHLGDHRESTRIKQTAEANAKASAKWSGAVQLIIAAVAGAVTSIGTVALFIGRLIAMLRPVADKVADK